MIKKFVNSPKDYLVGLIFEAGGREYKIASDEKPKADFYSAMATVVYYAVEHFGIPEYSYTMKQLAFGDKKTTLILAACVSTGDAMKVQLPAISTREVIKKNHGVKEYDTENPQNLYNEAVKAFSEQMESYIRGETQQMNLFTLSSPFRAVESFGDESGEEQSEDITQSESTLPFGRIAM